MIRATEFEPADIPHESLIEEVDAVFSEGGLLSKARNF